MDINNFKNNLIGNWIFEDNQFIEFRNDGMSYTGFDGQPYKVSNQGNTIILHIPIIMSVWAVVNYGTDSIIVDSLDIDGSRVRYTLTRI